MIGRRGERGSGISVLAARHDDDDNDIERKIKFKWKRPQMIYNFKKIFRIRTKGVFDIVVFLILVVKFLYRRGFFIYRGLFICQGFMA